MQSKIRGHWTILENMTWAFELATSGTAFFTVDTIKQLCRLILLRLPKPNDTIY